MDEYEFTINGIRHTGQFSDEDAKAIPALKKATPANKQATPANKAVDEIPARLRG